MPYGLQMEAGPARIHSQGGQPPPTYCWGGQAPGQDSFLGRPAMTYRSQMEAGPARIHSWGGRPPPTYCWAGQATGPNAQSMLAGPFLQTVRGDWPTQPDMRNEQAGPFPQAATVGWPCYAVHMTEGSGVPSLNSTYMGNKNNISAIGFRVLLVTARRVPNERCWGSNEASLSSAQHAVRSAVERFGGGSNAQAVEYVAAMERDGMLIE
ncbi:hypothetical protein DFH29DRAFT_1071366 [Suillus ampliporus]|nr:hypothetical protein DFH29DRAFT_1071366 [Suillus ampliporus]